MSLGQCNETPMLVYRTDLTLINLKSVGLQLQLISEVQISEITIVLTAGTSYLEHIELCPEIRELWSD